MVVTLALGIGLNAAMYTLLSRLFLEAPPHIEAPDELHRVWVRERFRCDENGDPIAPMYARERTDWADFSALGADVDRFGAVAGYTRARPMQNGRGQQAEELQVSWVTGELLALLGARPALGRPIVAEDDDVAAEPVAVIGNGYWQRRFGGTREALGATLTFGEITYTIVGVMPAAFAGPEPHAADVWLPLHLAATDARDNWRDSCSGFSLAALLRLAPGTTAEAAEAAATSALRAARADSPRHDTEGAVVLGPVLPTRGPGRLGGDMLLPLVVGGVAGTVLLIAAANVTNLLMLRVAARRRELAVRHALGAGRWAVGRLLVMESLVLATLSGGAALGLAAVASRVLRSTLLPQHQWAGGPLDSMAIAFTAVAAFVVGLATAAAPAVYAARSGGIDRLDGLRGARALGAPVRTGLIVVQAALSLVLLNGAAIFYGSFDAARKLDVGYAKENLLTVQMGTGWGGTPREESTINAMETRVRSLPGVLDVARTTAAPMTMVAAGLALRPEAPGELPRAGGPYENFVTENYFRVAGLDFEDGRGFTERDRAGAPRVAVVNARFARLVWPGRSAVDRCLFVGQGASACSRVVGVTETALEFGVQDVNRVPHFYLPLESGVARPGVRGAPGLVSDPGRADRRRSRPDGPRRPARARGAVPRAAGQPRAEPAGRLRAPDPVVDGRGGPVRGRRPAGVAAGRPRPLRRHRLRRSPARAGVRHPARARRPRGRPAADGDGPGPGRDGDRRGRGRGRCPLGRTVRRPAAVRGPQPSRPAGPDGRRPGADGGGDRSLARPGPPRDAGGSPPRATGRVAQGAGDPTARYCRMIRRRA